MKFNSILFAFLVLLGGCGNTENKPVLSNKVPKYTKESDLKSLLFKYFFDQDIVENIENFDYQVKLPGEVKYKFGNGIESHLEENLLLLKISYDNLSKDIVNGEKYYYFDTLTNEVQTFSFYHRHSEIIGEKPYSGLRENIEDQSWDKLNNEKFKSLLSYILTSESLPPDTSK